MRITREAKERTRQRLLEAGAARFDRDGFAEASTRDIARDAGLAAGTLFNYFPNKESLAMTLLEAALDQGLGRWQESRRGDEDLLEELFAHVAAGLRALRPHRAWVGQVLETAMSPFARSSVSREGDAIRARHLETVTDLLTRHRGADPDGLGFVAVHLYWTLYLGVLAYWSGDDSEHQADTLVVLDQSLRLFVAALPGPDDPGPSAPPFDPTLLGD